MTKWQPAAAPTLIGSMPHRDRNNVIDFILREMGEIPVWPQLPAYEPEQMMIQYLEGLPGVRFDAGKVVVDTQSEQYEQELYAFYEEYLELEAGNADLDQSRFKLGPETGKTFFEFMEALRNADVKPKAVKGQIAGPFTLLCGLKDQHQRMLLFDEQYGDVMVKHLAMKARYQAERLNEFDCPVIIFMDEPGLAGYGSSAFVGVTGDEVRGLLTGVADAIHSAGALAGVHICANTEWPLAFDSPLDIVNFDSYNFFDKFVMYREQVIRYLQEGRVVAWGAVPTSEPDKIREETASSLADRWFGQIEELSGEGVSLETILRQSLFTPSCGCATMSESDAERVVELTRELSKIIKERSEG